MCRGMCYWADRFGRITGKKIGREVDIEVVGTILVALGHDVISFKFPLPFSFDSVPMSCRHVTMVTYKATNAFDNTQFWDATIDIQVETTYFRSRPLDKLIGRTRGSSYDQDKTIIVVSPSKIVV
ncbi:hypothetical protein V6N11_069651 [Hibiscus sabdariffa]|uniref:Uncharacterized protein n=1 Tax=Hibiscus sabdariffa TaxID=183260 RepID=A0ABR2Q403_9ROSI